MKKGTKIGAVLLLVSMIGFSLCACGQSDADRAREARREANLAEQEYEQAKKNYQNLEDDLDRYNKLREQMRNAK